MPNADRGVVKPPNGTTFGPGGAANNGFVPLTRMAPGTMAPNVFIRDGMPGGSANLTRMAGDIPDHNRQFDVDNVGNSQINNFPVQPGKGDVPVNPFLASGPGLAQALPIADEAKRGAR